MFVFVLYIPIYIYLQVADGSSAAAQPDHLGKIREAAQLSDFKTGVEEQAQDPMHTPEKDVHAVEQMYETTDGDAAMPEDFIWDELVMPLWEQTKLGGFRTPMVHFMQAVAKMEPKSCHPGSKSDRPRTCLEKTYDEERTIGRKLRLNLMHQGGSKTSRLGGWMAHSQALSLIHI